METSFQRSLTTETNPIDGQEWSTTSPLTTQEEDAVVTLVVIVLGIIIAIVGLFSMGVFLDCKHQRRDTMKKNTRLRLKISQLSQPRNHNCSGQSLARDMCPNDTTQFGAIRMTEDAAV